MTDIGAVHPHWKPSASALPRISTDKLKDWETAASVAVAYQEACVKAARQDPCAFMEYCFHDEEDRRLQPAWFHRQWQGTLDNHRRCVIVAPRGHGKTTTLVARVLWELGRNPNLRIKIACASDSKAMDRLFELTQHIELNERVREVFPALVPADRGSWTKHQIVVRRTALHRDASVEAMGITSTATGGRCDLMVADDVVDRRNALNFPALRQVVKNAWNSDWMQLVEPEGRVWYICTLWHKDDLSHALLKNTEYHTVKHSVGSNLESIWPERWPHAKLQQKLRQIGPVEFARAYRNVAQDESAALIRPEWIAYATRAEMEDATAEKDSLVVLSYDLASGPRKTAGGQVKNQDYTACAALLVAPKARRVWVVDAWRDRIGFTDQVARIVADTRRWKPHKVLVETVQYQHSLLEHLQDHHPEVPVRGVVPKVSKALRLEAISPYLSQGRVAFLSRLDPAGLTRPERGDLVSELLDFPLAEHDDMVDAFTQGVRWVADSVWLGDDEDEAADDGGDVTARILGEDSWKIGVKRRPWAVAGE